MRSFQFVFFPEHLGSQFEIDWFPKFNLISFHDFLDNISKLCWDFKVNVSGKYLLSAWLLVKFYLFPTNVTKSWDEIKFYFGNQTSSNGEPKCLWIKKPIQKSHDTNCEDAKRRRRCLHVCVFSNRKNTINLQRYTHWFTCQSVLKITRWFLQGRELWIPPSWVGGFPGRYMAPPPSNSTA